MAETIEQFAGIVRLYGEKGFARLRRSHVCVVGLGGVGSWAVEALARTGVGRLTLVDLDEVCVSNVNRQLHALHSTVGRPKVEVMADRVREINPACQTKATPEFFTESTAASLFSDSFDFVLDAIDDVRNKCLLIATARARGIPVVACGGAGGRRDPTAVRVADLAYTTHDRLLQKVRERLRKEHGFPRGEIPFAVDAVFSPEPPVYPAKDGSICATRETMPAEPGDVAVRLNCDWGLGSATFVTGAFGFAAAGLIAGRLAEES